MAISTTGVTPLATWIQERWPDELSDATEENTVLSELVDRQYESVMSHGDVIRIPDRSNVAVRIKTEDTSATYSNITESQQSITVNRHAYSAFVVEDIAKLQSSWDARSAYTESAGYSLVAFIEGDGTSGMVSLGSSFSQLIGTYSSDPTDDDWLRLVQYLDDGAVPRTDRFIWCNPATAISLLKQERYTNQQYVGQDKAERAILNAKVTKIYGANVYESNLNSANPSSANSSIAWFCHKRGVALIMQRKPQAHSDFLITEIGTAVLVDCVYQFAERLIAPSDLGGSTSNDRFNAGVKAA